MFIMSTKSAKYELHTGEKNDRIISETEIYITFSHSIIRTICYIHGTYQELHTGAICSVLSTGSELTDAGIPYYPVIQTVSVFMDSEIITPPEII